jgi:hypothetical protein
LRAGVTRDDRNTRTAIAGVVGVADTTVTARHHDATTG